MYPLVSGYKLLVGDTCIRLHVSGVNAALRDVTAVSHVLPAWFTLNKQKLKQFGEEEKTTTGVG